MARPIKETPELYGEDAKRFETLISHPKPVSKEERERAKRAYEIMQSISNFQWWHSLSDGCRFLTVDALSTATHFYEKNGFQFFTELDKDEETRLMFYDLKNFIS